MCSGGLGLGSDLASTRHLLPLLRRLRAAETPVAHLLHAPLQTRHVSTTPPERIHEPLSARAPCTRLCEDDWLEGEGFLGGNLVIPFLVIVVVVAIKDLDLAYHTHTRSLDHALCVSLPLLASCG